MFNVKLLRRDGNIRIDGKNQMETIQLFYLNINIHCSERFFIFK